MLSKMANAISEVRNNYDLGFISEFEANTQVLATMINATDNDDIKTLLSDKLVAYTQAYEVIKEVNTFVDGVAVFCDSAKK